MELEMVQGCICDSIEVDGKSISDLSEKESKRTLKKICDFLGEQEDGLNFLLQKVLEWYGDFESSDKPCECCGDWIHTYKLKI